MHWKFQKQVIIVILPGLLRCFSTKIFKRREIIGKKNLRLSFNVLQLLPLRLVCRQPYINHRNAQVKRRTQFRNSLEMRTQKDILVIYSIVWDAKNRNGKNKNKKRASKKKFFFFFHTSLYFVEYLSIKKQTRAMISRKKNMGRYKKNKGRILQRWKMSKEKLRPFLKSINN